MSHGKILVEKRQVSMERYFDINEQGCSIRSKLYCADPAAVKRVALYCHGFGSYKETKSAETFAHRIIAKWKGTAVIAFDWPCHGADARKSLLLEDCDTYLRIVVEYAKQRFEVEDVYAYGASFGGYLLLKYLSEHGNPFRKVALRCPALAMYDTLTSSIIGEDDLRKIESGKVVLVGFDRQVKVSKHFLDNLREFDVREREYFDFADDILIVHGTADELVSFEASKEFADANVIELVAVEGADHRFHDPKKMDTALACIIDFFMK